MWGILGELLLDPGGIVDEVRDWRRERRSRQRARTATIRCGLRVVEGSCRGLSRRWTRGAARVPPGALVFEPDSRSRTRMTITVRSATLQLPGDNPRWSVRKIGPQARRIVLETDQATLEWLVPEELLERSMGVTRRSVRDTRGGVISGASSRRAVSSDSAGADPEQPPFRRGGGCHD